MKKRALTMMLALALCLTLLPTAAWAAEHSDHCICGETHQSIGDHNTATTPTWTAWEDDDSLPDTAGNYYLTQDVTIDKIWQPISGTVLCLNGHDITMTGNYEAIFVDRDQTFTLTDCHADSEQGKITHTSGIGGQGIAMMAGTVNIYGGQITGNTANTASAEGKIGGGVYNHCGTLNMYGGTISDNKANDGGGVMLYPWNKETAKFNLYGGTIKDNEAESGAGVYVHMNCEMLMTGGKISGNKAVADDNNYGGGVNMRRNAKFTMTGGEISGNKAGDGGGVYMVNAAMYVGGTAKVTGNTNIVNGRANNIDLFNHGSDNVLQLVDGKPLESGAVLGLSKMNEGLVVSMGAAAKSYFTLDMPNDYRFVEKDGDLRIEKIPYYAFVGNVRVTDDNAANVLGNGTVKYDVATNTLTLTNANITGGHIDTSDNYNGVELRKLSVDGGDVIEPKLVLVGNNTINLPATTDYVDDVYGIDVDGDLTISGTGSLTVTTCASTVNSAYGIDASDLTIDGSVTLNVTAGAAVMESIGIYVNDMTIGGTAKLTATAGAVTGNDEYSEVDSIGVYADDLTMYANTSLTGVGGNATASNEVNSYGIYVEENLDVKAGATIKGVGGDAKSLNNYDDDYPSYVAKSFGIYVSGDDEEKQTIYGATVIATAGNAEAEELAGSYGLYLNADTYINGATTVTATGAKATAIIEAESVGIYASMGLEFADYEAKMSVTAKGGVAEAHGAAQSFGIYVSDANCDAMQFALGIGGENVEVTATANSATSTGFVAADNNDDDDEEAVSAGIYYTGDKDQGDEVYILDGAKVTATGGVATAPEEAKSYGIYAMCDLTVDEKATTVTANAGKALANGAGEAQVADVWSVGLCAERFAVDGDANVNATGGTAVALTGGKDGNDDDGYEYSFAYSLGVQAEVFAIPGKGTLTAKGGTATYKDGDDCGKNVSALSGGLYLDSDEYDDEQAEKPYAMYIDVNDSARLTATGGNALGQYTPLSLTDGVSQPQVGAGSYGIVACYHVMIVAEADESVNIKAVGGNAEMNSTGDTPGGYVVSHGVQVFGGTYVQHGGAVLAESATVTGGMSSDNNALVVYNGNNGATLQGLMIIGDGWLKMVSTDSAVTATTRIVLMHEQENFKDQAHAVIVTPENGRIDETPDGYYFTIYDGEGENAKVASTVLIWDGTTKAYAEPVTNSGGGGHKKNDTTKEDEKKDETKTDEQTGTGEFTDVKDSDYFSGAVDWASKKGITGGTTPNTFGPHENCTRGQLVTFLWRAAEKPEADHELTFTDVKPGMYYKDAVTWAAMLEIVKGYSETEFAPDDNITREQMAAVLYRFAKAMGMDTTQGGMAAREFADWEQVSDYAKAAVQWAVNAGIMQGDNGYLLPQDECTRAQIVTMLHRLLGE